MDYIRKVDPLNLQTSNLPESWRIFWQNYQIFATAAEVDKKTDNVKIAMFLNAIGPEAVEVFNSFHLSEDDKKKYKAVTKAFENFCKVKKNEVYESFIFHNRKQEAYEPFDNFLMEIKKLVRRCDFADQESRMLRDRIVLGTRDKALQKKLLEVDNLNLDKAVAMARAAEIAKHQMEKLQPDHSYHHHVNLMSYRPYLDMSHKESELIEYCTRALADGKHHDLVDKLRLLCLSRGANGILGLGRVFRRMDGNGSKKLNLEEFTQGLEEEGLECPDHEISDIFKKFDHDGSGSVHMTDLLVALRPYMSPGRVSITEKAFEKLDKNNDGVISAQDIKNVYSVKNHPLYITGDLTKDQIMKLFLGSFEDSGVIDGEVTKEEFMNYYSGVSASIDNDTYFDLMMRQSYKL